LAISRLLNKIVNFTDEFEQETDEPEGAPGDQRLPDICTRHTLVARCATDYVSGMEEEAKDQRLQLVLTRSLMRKINELRRSEPVLPNKSEAVRRLIEIALSEKKSG